MDLEELLKQGLITPKQDRFQLSNEPNSYEIVPVPKKCDDCDLVVKNRIVATSLNHSLTNGKSCPHWKTYCRSCKMFLNPITGKFDISDRHVLSSIIKARLTNKDK